MSNLIKQAAEALIQVIKENGADLAKGVLQMAVDAESIDEIVISHALGAAVASVASGWIPGAGGLAATAASAGFIWTMYGRINGKIGLPLSANVVKSLATAMVTNLGAYFVGGVITGTLFSLIPGIGSLGASAVVGGTSFGMTYASGYVYLKALTALFRAGHDPTRMDAAAIKQAAQNVVATEDMKTVIADARSRYKPPGS